MSASRNCEKSKSSGTPTIEGGLLCVNGRTMPPPMPRPRLHGVPPRLPGTDPRRVRRRGLHRVAGTWVAAHARTSVASRRSRTPRPQPHHLSPTSLRSPRTRCPGPPLPPIFRRLSGPARTRPFEPASPARFARPTFEPPLPSHLGRLPGGDLYISAPHQEPRLVHQAADLCAHVAAGGPDQWPRLPLTPPSRGLAAPASHRGRGPERSPRRRTGRGGHPARRRGSSVARSFHFPRERYFHCAEQRYEWRTLHDQAMFPARLIHDSLGVVPHRT